MNTHTALTYILKYTFAYMYVIVSVILVVVVDLSSSSIHSTSRTASSNRSPHSSLWLGKI